MLKQRPFLIETLTAIGLIAAPFVLPHLGFAPNTVNRILVWGLFGIGFDILPAPPAGIAKNVDVGRPKGEAEKHLVVVITRGFVVLGARFDRDGLAHGVYKVRPKKHKKWFL